jgi:Uma2 family endonuclease
MAERAQDWIGERMDEATFLAFTDGREERWELVDGVVERLPAAERRHDRIVVNTVAMLGNQLRGRTCEPFSGDTFVRIPGGNYRMPDAGVECGTPDDADRAAQAPALVVEVSSPSTRYFDLYGKVDEYKRVAALRHIVLIDSDAAQATLWTRAEGQDWTHETVKGRSAVLAMPLLDLQLPMQELYDRVVFAAHPTLVGQE